MKNDYLEIHELYHHGIKGQKWGIRRYQNEDGSLTEEGKKRYGISDNDIKIAKKYISLFDKNCYKTPNSKNKEDVVSIIKYDRSRGNKSNRYFNDAIDKATVYLIHHFAKNEKIALSYAYVPGFGDVYVKGPGDFNDDDLKKWFKKSPNKDEILHTAEYEFEDELDLEHHGIKGQRWGIRRFQNEDGSFTDAGKARYKVDKSGNPTGSGIRKFKLDQRSIKGQQLYEKGKTVGGIRTGQSISNLILGSLAIGTIKTAFKGSNPSKVISRGEFRARSILAGIGAVSIASLAAINIKSHSDVNKLKAYYANGSHQYHEISKKEGK